ncbi:MAG TPA: hypothetical protein VF590_04310 [Isosphaeraceae bacterium]|jgi:hypothetical protein
MKRQGNPRHFRPILDALPSRLIPSGLTGAVPTYLSERGVPDSNIYLSGIEPRGPVFEPVSIDPNGNSHPYQIDSEGPLDPWFLDPNVPKLIF